MVKGRKSHPAMAAFGEKVHYRLLRELGDQDLDHRWGLGMWRLRIDEALIATERGVVRARSVIRRPPAERWDWELVQTMRGLPWKPVPDKKGIKAPTSIKPQSLPIMPEAAPAPRWTSLHRRR